MGKWCCDHPGLSNDFPLKTIPTPITFAQLIKIVAYLSRG